MGRPLFSKKYANSPPVHTEPERFADPFCRRWSATNNFNPDSDEFFANAQEERVLSPGEVQPRIPVDGVVLIMSDASSMSDTASAGTGESEAGSLATDNIETIDDVGQGWGIILGRPGAAGSQWLTGLPDVLIRSSLATRQVATDPLDGNGATNLPSSPALIPATENASVQMPTPPLSPPLEPSPLSAAADVVDNTNNRLAPEDISSNQAVLPLDPPMTPQRHNVRGATQTMFTPSPPPSVTPRFYSWQSHAIPAIPASPTRLRGARDGPLTNPLARRSYIRIGTSQAPVLVTNTAN